MTKPKTQKQLSKEWYAKLKAEGFDDIEYSDGSLRAAHARHPTSLDPLRRQAVEEYYTLCTHFLYEFEFERDIHKTIWEYHTNGLSARSISRILKKVKLKTKIGKSHDTIWRVIKKYEDKMKAMYLSI